MTFSGPMVSDDITATSGTGRDGSAESPSEDAVERESSEMTSQLPAAPAAQGDAAKHEPSELNRIFANPTRGLRRRAPPPAPAAHASAASPSDDVAEPEAEHEPSELDRIFANPTRGLRHREPPQSPASHGPAADANEPEADIESSELNKIFRTLLAEEGGGGEKIPLSRLRQWDEIAFLIEECGMQEDELVALWERVVGSTKGAMMDYAAFFRFNWTLEGMFEFDEDVPGDVDMVVDQREDAAGGAIELAELRLQAAIKRSLDTVKLEGAPEQVVESAERELLEAMAHLEMLRTTIKGTLDAGTINEGNEQSAESDIDTDFASSLPGETVKHETPMPLSSLSGETMTRNGSEKDFLNEGNKQSVESDIDTDFASSLPGETVEHEIPMPLASFSGETMTRNDSDEDLSSTLKGKDSYDEFLSMLGM